MLHYPHALGRPRYRHTLGASRYRYPLFGPRRLLLHRPESSSCPSSSRPQSSPSSSRIEAKPHFH